MDSTIIKYPYRHAIILYAVSIAVVSSIAYLFPGVSVLNVVALATITGVAIFGVRYTALSGRAAVTVMAVASTLLSIGIVLNTWYFTTRSGGTLSAPVLVNIDASRTWNDAIWRLGDTAGIPAPPEHGLFGAMTAVWMTVFGKSIAVAIIPGMVALLATLILVGLTTLRLGHSITAAVTAMASTAAVSYWITSGMILIKDPHVILSAAMVGYVLTGGEKRIKHYMSAFLYIAAVILTALVRPNYILVILAGLVVVPCKREVPPRRRIALIVIGLAIWLIPTFLHLTPRADFVISADKATLITYDDERLSVLNAVIGNFTELAWYTKLALMPLWAAMQFLIPFPWNFLRDVPFGITQAWSHIAYIWYIFGGTVIYYLMQCYRRRSGITPTLRLTLWACFCWLVPCYLNAGTISRYALPAVALMAPAVGATLVASFRSRSFATMMTLWSLLIATALVTCYHLQNSPV